MLAGLLGAVLVCGVLVLAHLLHVIYTDTHSPDKRPPRMAQGVQQLEKLLGKETAARIVRNGDELFHDQELGAATLHQPKKFLGMWI